jgi:hypothetical protein
MSTMKPVIKIERAYIIRGIDNEYLFGIPMEYPEEHQWYPGCVSGKRLIRTSPIVSKEDHVIETERSIYAVQSWETQPDHLKVRPF